MIEKLKSNLAEQLSKTSSSDLVDVVVELLPQGDGQEAPAAAPQSRSAQIAARKAEFDRSVAGIDEAVRRAGGQITGQAWINRTVRARVPAGKVPELCRDKRVAAVDAPGRIAPEAG